MKILIDCDAGNAKIGANTDDGLAIALALAASECELVGVSVLSGNVRNYEAFESVKRILRAANSSLPIFLGASKALLEPSEIWRNRLDNLGQNYEFLWQNLEQKNMLIKGISEKLPAKFGAPSKIVQLAREYKKQLKICAIGPLTNIALACTLDSEFAQNVGEIVIMGGVFDMPQYSCDTNFGFDPEAASIVLNSGAKITLAPYNVTMQTMLKESDLEQLKNANPLANYIYETTLPWLKYAQLARGTDGMWVHDVLTLAYLLWDGLFTSENYAVKIALDKEFRATCKRSKNSTMPEFFKAKNDIKILKSVKNDELICKLIAKIKEFSC